jgi:cellulose synthase/poly-beta-1,6-N-acetylglucosamine synthase-like glycosyltransferase
VNTRRRQLRSHRRASNMHADGLPFAELFAPVVLILGAAYLLGPTLPLSRPAARLAVFAIVWLVIVRYLSWRIFSTVLPAHGTWYEVGWIWLCFSVELFALTDAFFLYIAFLRTTDHRAEADVHEARLRALPPESLPSVDVYIPTYNEPFEVLEKTIIGALCLDYANFNVWILDDGRRPWLKDFCAQNGAGYLTRPDNCHAKAGNINHALTKTNAEFVAIFDADFIPQRNFLARTIGFFGDPNIGIVQVPHAFYNQDLVQANLALRKSLPDDQRFFFDAIMPSRDGWDAAFCCGSNSIICRSALRAVGDTLPTDSVTEDMLLSLKMLRKGYVTRYLCERLAFGLAPESIKAFFVQRQRWARGAMQILYLAAGPLGNRLPLVQRILFLPTHWLSQCLMLLMAIIAPLIFLWTGIPPLIHVTTDSVIYYLVPMVLAVVGGFWVYAPHQYFPLAAQVLGTFQSFKLLPTVIATLAKPFGHTFKVTPKGSAALAPGYDIKVFWMAAILMALTAAGIMVNTVPEWRIVSQLSLLPMVALWSAINIIVLFLVCMLSLQAPVRRGQERFEIDEPVRVIVSSGAILTGRIRDISLSGVGCTLDQPFSYQTGERLRVFITEVGFIAATMVRRNEKVYGIQFDLPPCVERDLLIRKLYTGGHDTAEQQASAWSTTVAMLQSIWKARNETAMLSAVANPSPMMTEPTERLPAQSFVLSPQRPKSRLSDLVERRRDLAA